MHVISRIIKGKKINEEKNNKNEEGLDIVYEENSYSVGFDFYEDGILEIDEDSPEHPTCRNYYYFDETGEAHFLAEYLETPLVVSKEPYYPISTRTDEWYEECDSDTGDWYLFSLKVGNEIYYYAKPALPEKDNESIREKIYQQFCGDGTMIIEEEVNERINVYAQQFGCDFAESMKVTNKFDWKSIELP